MWPGAVDLCTHAYVLFFETCKLFCVIYGLAVKRVMVSQKHSDHSGTNPASCFVCTGFLTLEVMPVECESDHLPPRTKVKNEWSHTSTPPVVPWHVQRQLCITFKGLKTVLCTLA